MVFRTSISPVSQWTHASQKSRRPRRSLADNQGVSFTAMVTTSKKIRGCHQPYGDFFFRVLKGDIIIIGYHISI